MFINQILTKLKSLVYSKSETDSLLNGKASSSHTHTKSQITDFPTIPSKTSQLTNDSGFLTAHQSLSDYSTKANTVKSLSISGKTITVIPGSGNAYTLTTQDTNTTYSNFVKSGSGAAAGLVPAPSTTAGTTKYLREDGTWQVPPDHTYTVNNATLTIQKNGSNVATFTANASSNATANITVPTKTSQLTNDSGYITSSGSCNYANYSGYVQGTRTFSTYVNAVKYGNAFVSSNQTGFSTIWNAPTKNYRVGCAVYTGNNDDVYLCYSVTNANVSSSTNSVSRSCVWNADTGILSATGFSGSLTGNVTGNCSGSAGSVAWGNVSGKPTIPTKTSQLTNDSGFLTSHQSLSNYSTLANTIKSLSISGKTITYTKGDNTTGTLTTQDTNTTYSNFVKSGSGAKAGLVPAPSTTAGTTKYLREDGTWQVPPDHTYTVNNATLTIQKNGSNVATFTANASSNVTANISVPTKVSQLTNDSGFLTSHQSLSGYIPRSGGAVMTGQLLGRNNNSDVLYLCGGTGVYSGASVSMTGKDSSNGGNITFYATNGSSARQMSLYYDGGWTWNGTAVQITSDQRLKQQITEIDDKLLDAWEDVELVQFKYNDAVNEKGKDKARLHTGYVVQQIDTACKSHGVDISEYGLYCHEEYPEETEEVEVEQADGTKAKERKVIREANEHYSLRYTEVYAVECKYLRRENSRLKENLASIEERLEKLEKAENS